METLISASAAPPLREEMKEVYVSYNFIQSQVTFHSAHTTHVTLFLQRTGGLGRGGDDQYTHRIKIKNERLFIEHTQTHTHRHTHTDTHTNTHTHSHTQTHTHTYIDMNTHIHTHEHTYEHTHTQVLASRLKSVYE